MNEWSQTEPERLARVIPVVHEVATIVDSAQIMLVGAQCRDLLHWRYGCGSPPRSTNDTDLAIALLDWDKFELIRQRFSPSGDSGHRFEIAGEITDVIAFGGVEEPSGKAAHPPGHFALNVHGFADAYKRADDLPISHDLQIKIPRVEGYAVLKTHAWLDRASYYEYRDGPDLALATRWYSQDLAWIYSEPNQWALELHEFDHRLASASLLGRAMRNGIEPQELAVLRARIADADRDLLAHHFGVGSPGWPHADPARRLLVDAMFDEIT